MISRSQRILGLDIGSNCVKAVELARAGNRFTVTGYAQQEIAAAGTLRDALVAVLREGRFKSKQVVSSVSGRSVIVRYINTPYMKSDDLKSSMRFEADKYIPFETSEVILDCVSLDEKPAPGSADMRVVLVAVKKEVVDEHVRLLQDVGLFPCIVDVDCFALGNGYELTSDLSGRDLDASPAAVETKDAQVAAGAAEAPADKEEAAAPAKAKKAPPAKAPEKDVKAPDKDAKPAEKDAGQAKPPARAYALVDIGAQKTNINIMEGHNSYFTREVYIGGDDMTEAVAKHLSINPAEAEIVKRKGEQESEVLEAVSQVLDDLANEIFLSFDYFENQFDAQIKTVYLSGGGSRLKGIQGVLGQTLNRTVEIWDPVAGFDISLTQQQASRLKESAPQLAVAMGLASRLRKV